MKQFQLAKLAGLPRETLNRIERNRHVPGTETLFSIAQALGVKLTDLHDPSSVLLRLAGLDFDNAKGTLPTNEKRSTSIVQQNHPSVPGALDGLKHAIDQAHAAGIDSVTAAAIEYQRVTFVDAVTRQGNVYNEKLDALNAVMERIATTQEKLATAIDELRNQIKPLAREVSVDEKDQLHLVELTKALLRLARQGDNADAKGAVE